LSHLFKRNLTNS